MATASTTMPRMGRRRKEIDQSTYSGRVAVRLRMLREKAGKTVPEMAAALRIPVQTYYTYENGNAEFPFDRAPIIADVLGISVRQLFPKD